MRNGPSLFIRLVLLALSTMILIACEVEFTPQITPVDFSTPEPLSDFVIIPPVQTLTPLQATGTADAIATAFPKVTPAPLANSAGDPNVASYQEVYCEDVNRVCYTLCYQNTCGTYDGSHPRVTQFIKAVDDRETAILEWELEGRTKTTSGFAAFGSCATSLLAAAPVYVLVTAADPEPISKTILAVGGLIVGGVVCGGSLLVRSNSVTKQGIDEREISKQTLIAEQSFRFLIENVGEAEINE